MAALTLPNPNMDFVPLDVLTAEEMNQIVQNIETLAAAFPITADNLADNAVTSRSIMEQAVSFRKIDWQSLGYREVYAELNGELLSRTSRELINLDVSDFPVAAKFVVLSEFQANVSSGTVTGVITDLVYNGVTRSAGNASTWGTHNSVSGVFTKVSGQNTVRLSGYIDNNERVEQRWASLCAFRVG